MHPHNQHCMSHFAFVHNGIDCQIFVKYFRQDLVFAQLPRFFPLLTFGCTFSQKHVMLLYNKRHADLHSNGLSMPFAALQGCLFPLPKILFVHEILLRTKLRNGFIDFCVKLSIEHCANAEDISSPEYSQFSTLASLGYRGPPLKPSIKPPVHLISTLKATMSPWN